MASTKQPSVEAETGCAQCPFSVKRKRGITNKRELMQEWPFGPDVGLRRHELDVSYTVEPRQQWLALKRYSSFTLNLDKYYKGNFAYIANDATVEQQNAVKADPDLVDKLQPAHHWVAKILEIRAADEHHVYARIYWMYSPDELPLDTVIDGKLASAQQTEYGRQELVASNHMDIINVTSMVKPVTVTQSLDREGVEATGVLYWRQALDYRTLELFSFDERDTTTISRLPETSSVMAGAKRERRRAASSALLESKTEEEQSRRKVKAS
ncbi:hypothetical protein PCL_10539 [Purpureocillium lilacinum]|uniref:BAH domain-containing protein n=1 Tax=Purpureocillium lilacinum TaxID=33203 RepID=A0A2U3DQ39_PURLI|nr:hypothetical protein PCL_10539 [Purpureocillium lilacinum]